MTTSSHNTRVPARELFADAVAHHLAGRADAALQAYRDVRAADANLAAAMNTLGALLGAPRTGGRSDVIVRECGRGRTHHGEAHNNLGIALASANQHEAATPL